MLILNNVVSHQLLNECAHCKFLVKFINNLKPSLDNFDNKTNI